MTAIEFKNTKGEVRYQPQHPDGRRLYLAGWMLPWAAPKRGEGPSVHGRAVLGWDIPALYRTKRRAYRQLSRLIAAENDAEIKRFKEVK